MKGTPLGHMAHRQVASVAKELAGCAYDELAKNNQFYATEPSQRNWVKRNWILFCEEARKALAQSLNSPTMTEHMKAKIHEALVLDHHLKITAREIQIKGAMK